MPSEIKGDYSKYPDPIRDAFPLIAGEVLELRTDWDVYHRLFMSDSNRSQAMSQQLGGLLAKFQFMLQDELFLGIGRLTDKSRVQENLALKLLKKAIPFAKTADFGKRVEDALAKIDADAADIVKHRHKRIAHFDLQASLNSSLLPKVTFQQLRLLIEAIEAFLNLFYREFENSTMVFNLPADRITGEAERSSFEAKAYRLLEKSGNIPHGAWRKVMRGQSPL